MHPVVMTFTATVENGKVVLPPEVKLPSGTKVRVETLDGALTERATITSSKPDSKRF